MTAPDVRDDEGRYYGKVGSPSEHRTVGDYRAWCHDCSEWCYPSSPCGEIKCCATLTDPTEADRLRAAVLALADKLDEELVAQGFILDRCIPPGDRLRAIAGVQR